MKKLNHDRMVDEILKGVTTLEENDTTGECVLLWACRVEVQRVQKVSPS